MNTKRLEKLAKRTLPPFGARLAKRVMVYPRYQSQAKACREGFQAHGTSYPHKVLFIAGLPKSGTTWLERMIASYPGYHDLMIPDAAAREIRTGGSHDYDLPEDMFGRFEGMLVLTKMHVHGSEQNLRLLREAGVPHVVLYRDLRDVAVSYFFYVRQTPWHGEYPVYADLDVEQGLLAFVARTLPAYVDWVRGWHERCAAPLGYETRYEALLADTTGELTTIARHFGLDDRPETIARIVEAHSFKRLSQGRERGQGDSGSFFRSGTAGDWANHFTPRVKDAFKEKAGRWLIDFGYEEDLGW